MTALLADAVSCAGPVTADGEGDGDADGDGLGVADLCADGLETAGAERPGVTPAAGEPLGWGGGAR